MSINNVSENAGGDSSSLRLDSLHADQLNSVSQSYFRAAQKGDLKQLSEVMAPEFHFIDEHGKMIAAAGCSGSLEEALRRPEGDPDPTDPFFNREKIAINSFDVKEVRTQKIGGVVIESMLYSDNITVNPPNTRDLLTFDRNLRWTNIWAQSDSTFKLVLTQLTSLDTGKEIGVNSLGTGTAPGQSSTRTLLLAWSIIATILVIVLGALLLLRP